MRPVGWMHARSEGGCGEVTLTTAAPTTECVGCGRETELTERTTVYAGADTAEEAAEARLLDDLAWVRRLGGSLVFTQERIRLAELGDWSAREMDGPCRLEASLFGGAMSVEARSDGAGGREVAEAVHAAVGALRSRLEHLVGSEGRP